MKLQIKLPNILNNIFDKIKKLYSKHFIGKLIATVAFLGIVIWLIWLIPILGVKSGTLPEVDYTGLSETGAEIPHDAGKVMVAESDSKRLYIDSSTLNLKLEDKNTKKVWNAIVPGAKEASELSLLTVTYLGENNVLYEWDSYTYCTQLGSYTIHQIDNGVQIKMNINEGESERFNEYYPDKMSIDRYENFFLKGIEDKIASGEMDQTTGEKYKTTLSLIYKKSIMEECYAVTYTGTPPRSAVRQLIALAKILGYTQDMLIEDCNAMGLTVNFTEPAVFDITVEATLDGDDFIFRVPTQEMVSGNSYYTIQNIKVLPNFGTAVVTDYEDGYIFVPDGAGALMKFNTFDPAVPDYRRPVYDNDYFKDYYFMPEYAEELMMPVFGMTYGTDRNSTHGFLGIIECGAETSYINAKLGSTSKESPSNYNKVYSSFDVTQYSNVKVYGPLSDNNASYMADTGVLDVDYTIRYKLFPDTVTYYDMAMSYRSYLMEQWNISELKYTDQVKLYLDFLGGLSLTERTLGVPHDTSYSMTTYKELTDIIEELGDMKLAIQYSGFFNGGFENKLYNGAKLVSANGSKKELNTLRNLAKEKDIDLFFETTLSTVYDKGNGFHAKTHAIHDYSNKPAEIYRYSPAIGIFNGWFDFWETHKHYLVSPRYLDYVVDSFLKEAKDYDKLSVADLGNFSYSDYKFNKVISPYVASKVVDSNFIKLDEDKMLSIYNPFMKNLVYADYAEDISRESSDYASFYTTIPFRQLVMNGLTQATSENVNMSSNSYAYYVLQAVELGVYPKFTLSAKSVDILKETKYDNYYATEFAKQKDTMQKVYDECEAAWAQIGTMEITNHTLIQDKVYCTTYASGAKVISNYNLYSVTIDGREIPGLGYLITQE